MVRKLFKTGNSLVVSLPREAIDVLGLREGSEVEVTLDAEERRIIVSPAHAGVPGIDADFARQLDAFIRQYRPALESLAR